MNKMLADSLKLDHDACRNLNSLIFPCCEDMRELKGDHHQKIVEITDNAGKYLQDEYTVRIVPSREHKFYSLSFSSSSNTVVAVVIPHVLFLLQHLEKNCQMLIN